MGKGSKPKRAKAKNKRANSSQAHLGRSRRGNPETPPRQEAVRPTSERANHNRVKMPHGTGKHESPAMVIDHDQIAALYEAGQITYEQEQAARVFQEASQAHRIELGVSTGRSCLDIGPVGHDDSDGNPAVTERYYGLCSKMGQFQLAEVRRVSIEDKKLRRLQLLRDGLTAIIGC